MLVEMVVLVMMVMLGMEMLGIVAGAGKAVCVMETSMGTSVGHEWSVFSRGGNADRSG